MVLVKPSSYRAARDFTFQGVTYPKGAPISNVLIKKMPHLSSLLSRRFIEPVPDPYRRKGPWRHQATTIPNSMLVTTALATEAEAGVSSSSPVAEETTDQPKISHAEVHQHADYPASGTISDVKAWVGTDKDRASYALDHEDAKPNPRVTLLDYLNTIVEE